MRISHQTWLNYIKKLDAIDSKAADMMQEWVEANGLEDRQALVEYAYALTTKYGEAAAALACEMYDATALASGVTLPAAVPAETPSIEEVGRAVNGSLRHSQVQVPSTVYRLTKQSAADTTLQNTARDGAQFAWIPYGDTCPFCITLASRGWQYMSKKALKGGHAEHIHANCDCQYGVRFSEKDSVAGYDPKKYKEMYDNAEGSTPQEKINYMRREQRALNPEKYREQNNANYARRRNQLLLEAASPFKNSDTPLEIASYEQSKHMIGGRKYIAYMSNHEYPPSYLIITEEEAQNLVERYHGTGILKLDRTGNIIPSEMIVDNDKVIGYAVNNLTGEATPATGFKIHYSNKGTHIVPMYESQKEYWKERRDQNGYDWLLRQKN